MTLNLEAIEGSDHMTRPRDHNHDFDGWYRQTIAELITELKAFRISNRRLTEEVEWRKRKELS